MKRLLLSVFAAAITAAFVIPAPATAGDITLSGQYRLRGEFRDQGAFGKNDAESSPYLQRVRVTANAEVSDNVSAKVTLQDSRIWGKDENAAGGGPGLTDASNTVNDLDLHESYVNVKNLAGQPVSLKAGRQEISLGDQRLVGAFGWDNRARSFDALRFDVTTDAVDVIIASTKINEATTYTAGGRDGDQDFYILQGTVKAIPNHTLDLYWLYWRDGDDSSMIGNNTSVAANIVTAQSLSTYGFRLKGSFASADYTIEVPFQSGSIDTTAGNANYDIKAVAYAVRAGYTLPTSVKVRLGVEIAAASGDDNANDNEMNTFTNLFPTNHGHFGYSDRQGWRNMGAFGLNAKAAINDQLSIKAAYWAFALVESKDAWYGAGNWNTTRTGTFAADSTNTKDEVGSEIDVVVNYKIDSGASVQLGLSRFFTGDYIESKVGAANAENQDFAYLQIVSNF